MGQTTVYSFGEWVRTITLRFPALFGLISYIARYAPKEAVIWVGFLNFLSNVIVSIRWSASK